MKKIITLVCIVSTTVLGQNNQNRSDYYESAYKLYGTPLQVALHNIIKGHTVVSYASLWTHFQTTDKKANGKVWDMYSDIPGSTPPYEFTFVSNQCGNYSVEGDCYNREHSWPQSWFNEVSPPVSDMFHLFPTDGKVNGIRSNFNYGNVSSPSTTTKNGSRLGPNTFPGYSGTVFEPITPYKGDLARGHFYMSVRYYSEDGGWSQNGGTNKSDLLPWYANLLFSWHILDTVSTKEINRNNAVFGIQKNRNPFIDHPEFAAEIWQTSMSPAVVSISGNLSTSLIIDFSRYLDSISASTASNFILDNSAGNPVSIQWGLNNDVSKLLLTFPTLHPGTSYILQIKNLKSINNIVMADTIISFKSSGTSEVRFDGKNPNTFQLGQNFPNPFNPSTTITYQLPATGYVTLKVYDVLGKEVVLLVNEAKTSGEHTVTFDASHLNSGIYFYRLSSGTFSETKRMILMK
ncbi:MAG: endonuclease [Bacteroidota bacterium]|nr:endonuclease [Bacteroidota bacterium]